MRIHLVRNSTSANFGKQQQNIHLMRIYSTSAYYSFSAKIRPTGQLISECLFEI